MSKWCHDSACLNFTWISSWPRDPHSVTAVQKRLIKCFVQRQTPSRHTGIGPAINCPNRNPYLFLWKQISVWGIIVFEGFGEEGFSSLSCHWAFSLYSQFKLFVNRRSMAAATVNTLVWSKPSWWMQQQRDSITLPKSIKWKLTQSSGDVVCL